jgi:hypothetical protein
MIDTNIYIICSTSRYIFVALHIEDAVFGLVGHHVASLLTLLVPLPNMIVLQLTQDLVVSAVLRYIELVGNGNAGRLVSK